MLMPIKTEAEVRRENELARQQAKAEYEAKMQAIEEANKAAIEALSARAGWVVDYQVVQTIQNPLGKATKVFIATSSEVQEAAKLLQRPFVNGPYEFDDGGGQE
jgi:2-succinyl-5-enolpyruvyl-6-hydroxy-3-cyclohexene-1-carboxylate synthase